MPALIDEVGLIKNLAAYWNLDKNLPLYPDNVNTFYRRYDTYAEWGGSEIIAINSTITRDSSDPSLNGEIISTAPTTGGVSGLSFIFSSLIPEGVTNVKVSAYGFGSTLFIRQYTSIGNITRILGTFPSTLSAGNPVYSWQTFEICLGNYTINNIDIYIEATNYVGALLSVAINNGGTGYVAGDIGKTVDVGGSGTGGKVIITSLSGSVVNGVSISAAGTGYTNGATNVATSGGGTTGSGLTLNTTVNASPTGDYFKMDYMEVVSNAQYFNNTFTTTDGWANTTVSGGKLIQTSAVASKTFSTRLDDLRFRAYVRMTSGTNPILTVNSTDVAIPIDGTDYLVDVILPVSTSTVTLTSTGNTLSYSFIYIGTGSYSTYQPDAYSTSQALYPVGTTNSDGIYGNVEGTIYSNAYYFYKAFAFSNFYVPFASTSMGVGFLFYFDAPPATTSTMLSIIPPYSAGNPTGVSVKVGLSTSGANTYLTFTYVDASLATQVLIGKTSITSGTWHYAFVNHSGAAATIYVDGAPEPSFTSTLWMPYPSPSWLLLGAKDTIDTDTFTGRLQEIRLYSYVSADADIASQWQYYKSLISIPVANYGASVETINVTSGLVAFYDCLDTLPDPPDIPTRAFYFDIYSYPYNLSNAALLGTTRKIVNMSNVSYMSQGEETSGFTLATSIPTGNNYFRINTQYNGYGTRNLYVDISHGGGPTITTVPLVMNGIDGNAITMEYISSFGADSISNIKVYMNDAVQGETFTVNWMYYGDGVDTTKLLDATENGNDASLVEVFNGTDYGVSMTGSSSITTPAFLFPTEYSVSFWINPSSITSQTLFKKNLPTGYSSLPLSLALNAGNLTLTYAITTSTTSSLATTTAPISLNTLQHVVIVYSKSVFYIYIDGVQAIYKADKFSDANSSTIFGSVYTGIMNKMRIYYKGLSAGEVKYLFTNQR